MAILTARWIFPDAINSNVNETFNAHKHHLGTNLQLRPGGGAVDTKAVYLHNAIGDTHTRDMLDAKWRFKVLGQSRLQATNFEQFNEKVANLSKLQPPMADI